MRTGIFIFLLAVGVILVCYLSWISSPRLALSGIIPPGIVKWTDARENDTIRTGVPFIFLGLLTGIQLIFNQSHRKWWLLSWMFLVLLVVLAEFGQIFLPMRSCDWQDIGWGATGAALGLAVLYVPASMRSAIKKK